MKNGNAKIVIIDNKKTVKKLGRYEFKMEYLWLFNKKRFNCLIVLENLVISSSSLFKSLIRNMLSTTF